MRERFSIVVGRDRIGDHGSITRPSNADNLFTWVHLNFFRLDAKIQAIGSIRQTKMTSEQIDKLWSIDDPVAGYNALSHALQEHPESADELHTQICRSLGLQGKFDLGWAELAKVSENRSITVEVRLQLESGRLKNSSGDKSGAIPYFQKALDLATEAKLDFFAVDAAHMLAIATSGDESVRWNEVALKMSSDSPDARAQRWRGSLLNNLGWSYHDAGNYEESMRNFREAFEFQTKFGNETYIRIARWAIARCHRSMGQYSEALVILRELAQFPDVGYVSEELAENLLATGKPEEARPHFKRAYELLSTIGYLQRSESERLSRLSELSR